MELQGEMKCFTFEVAFMEGETDTVQSAYVFLDGIEPCEEIRHSEREEISGTIPKSHKMTKLLRVWIWVKKKRRRREHILHCNLNFFFSIAEA